MNLSQLLTVKARSQKRVGRGLSSGKGKTAGRGSKGQKARGSVARGFIGGTLPIYKKLPFRRGLGNSKRSSKMLPLSLSSLSVFKAESTVDLEGLIKQGIVKKSEAQKYGVKIMGTGEIDKALIVKVPVTSAAVVKIEKAGGKVVRD